MEVICLKNELFYDPIEQVVDRLKDKFGQKEDKWISGEEAMRKLRVSSKTTLQSYRDEGKIGFSPLGKKHFLYDVYSINEFLEKNL